MPRAGSPARPAPNLAMIEPVSDGIVVSVRVIPRAARSAIDGIREGALLVRVKAPPVEGAANEAVVALLAEVLGVGRRQVAIVSGTRGRHKRVRVTGVDARTAAARLIEVSTQD